MFCERYAIVDFIFVYQLVIAFAWDEEGLRVSPRLV